MILTYPIVFSLILFFGLAGLFSYSDLAPAFSFLWLFFVFASLFFFAREPQTRAFGFLPYVIVIFLKLTIFLSVFVFEDPYRSYIVADSIRYHLPNALEFAAILERGFDNSGALTFAGFERIYIANYYIGAFIYIFGFNAYFFPLFLIPTALLTVFFIKKSAAMVLSAEHKEFPALVYVLAPSMLMYGNQFYKEFLVHLLVSILCYLFLSKRFLLYFLVCFFLVYERFYLGAIFFAWALAYITISFNYIKKPSILAGGAIALICVVYYLSLSIPLNVESLLAFVSSSRAHHSEVNVTASGLFPIDLLRIILTPFPTWHKFTDYDSLDFVLISYFFFNFVIVATFFSAFLGKNRFSIIYCLGFVFLLFLLAYVQPFNGRVRDSFLPIMCVFATPNLMYLLRATYFARFFER
ncbi:hypothetical protein N9E24_00065 [Alphaproteobacteria bacterium]|nr:hypothetical protein [Alphaproteobacteria bacterium]